MTGHDLLLHGSALAVVLAALACVIARAVRDLRAARRGADERALGADGTAARFRATAEGRLVDCNEAFARLLGFAAPHDVVGRRLGDFYVESPRWDRLLTGLGIARLVTNVEVALHKRGGGVVWVLLSMVKREENGSTHLAGSVIDITARKRADELLREAETLRTVAQLATAAAHEINNPLNVIKGNLHLLSRSVERSLVTSRIAPALEAVKTLEAIVEKLSHVIRLEHAQQSSTLPEMLDLAKSAAPPAPCARGRPQIRGQG